MNAFNHLCQQGEFTRDDEHPDIVITVGGDGTLLGAFHHYRNQLDQIRFVGIHTGHLGFYTDWRNYEVDELIESLKKDKGERVSYPLLDVTVKLKNGETAHYSALNEATLRKVNGTLFCQVFINGDLFENFRGDGLCVATPTGSTGLSKSLGGAVVHPRAEVMQMAEMASINNRVYRTLSSPMIFAKDNVLTLRPESEEGMVMAIDHLTYDGNEIEEIQLKISKERISFAAYRHTPFWDRVEDAFIGSREVNCNGSEEVR
nr:NAD kinase [uncultured Granulicatella sp.]